MLKISPLVPAIIITIALFLLILVVFRSCDGCGSNQISQTSNKDNNVPPPPPPPPPPLPPIQKPIYETLPILKIKQFKNYPQQKIIIGFNQGYRIVLFDSNWTINWIKFIDDKAWGHIHPFNVGCEAKYMSGNLYYIPKEPTDLQIIEQKRIFRLKGSVGDTIAIWSDDQPSGP